MKFIKYLVFLLLIAFIGMAIYIAVQPNEFEVTQTATIKAPKAVIYELVSDSIASDWSSFWSASETLVQAKYAPNDSITQVYTSDQIKSSELKWLLQGNSDGSTTVTRHLDAEKLSFMTKAKTALFSNQESILSQQFATDLENLTSKVLASMAVYSINVDGITDYGGGFYMYSTTSSTSSHKMVAVTEQHQEIQTFMHAHNLTASGMPFTIFIATNPDNGDVIISNAVPVNEKVVVADNSTILCGYMPRTLAFKVTLQGDRTNLKEAWDLARKQLADQGLEPSKLSPFEVYKTDATTTPNPAQWITEIYIPIAETPGA